MAQRTPLVRLIRERRAKLSKALRSRPRENVHPTLENVSQFYVARFNVLDIEKSFVDLQIKLAGVRMDQFKRLLSFPHDAFERSMSRNIRKQAQAMSIHLLALKKRRVRIIRNQETELDRLRELHENPESFRSDVRLNEKLFEMLESTRKEHAEIREVVRRARKNGQLRPQERLRLFRVAAKLAEAKISYYGRSWAALRIHGVSIQSRRKAQIKEALEDAYRLRDHMQDYIRRAA